MRKVSTFDAKNWLSELIDAVASGETIEILRRGKPAAWLVPVPAPAKQFATAVEAGSWMRAQRKIEGVDIRALIDEGRR